ncbi:MAG: hypothetical protein ABIP74_00110 [Candidatus Saccharimonas sp.]
MIKITQPGFSAVEVLVTVIVGVVFIGAISQMYSVVMSDAATVRNRATASALAYTQARTALTTLSSTCAPSSSTITPSATLPKPISMSTVVDCPYTATYANAQLSRITVSVTYGPSSPQEKVKHVLYSY